MRKLAINTGGGDAPGLNAVIRAATLAALEHGFEIWGVRQGYRGLLEWSPDGLVRLDRAAVRGIAHLGGTILGSVNRGDPFHYPTKVPGHTEIVAVDRSADVVRRFYDAGFDALIAVGGDGSLRIAKGLHDAGLPVVIGVPKTIDNDVWGTEMTFGFDTAVSIATEAIDRLHTTAEALERLMVVEVMGRDAGWIALSAGLAGGADAILLPEIPFRYEPIVEKIRQREARGRHFSIIVAAEGALPDGGDVTIQRPADSFGAAVLGGLAERVADELARRTGKETRSIVLGHLQRGGEPTTYDRMLALRFGTAAVRVIADGASSGMVALRGERIELITLEDATSRTKVVPLDSDSIVTGREMGVAFGDEPSGHFDLCEPART